MSNGSTSRLSRGDRRRNDRLARLRAVVTRETAVLAFDLAADKQVCALTDQDSRVLARRTVRCKAWQLEAVGWGLARAAGQGSPRWWWRASRPGTAGGCWTGSPPSTGWAGLRAAAAGAPGPGGRGLHPQQERRHRRDDHRPAGDRAALLPARAGRPGLGAAAAPRRPPGRAGHRRRRRPAAAPRPARVRLAGGAGRRRRAAGLQELAGRGHRRAGPHRRHR